MHEEQEEESEVPEFYKASEKIQSKEQFYENQASMITEMRQEFLDSLNQKMNILQQNLNNNLPNPE